MGKALSPLLEKNILVIGSGFSFHNMQAFKWDNSRERDSLNDSFQDWIVETCSGKLPEEDMLERLCNWEKAPGARYAHPREEHLLPLHVCAAMAGTSSAVVFDDYILGKRAVALKW